MDIRTATRKSSRQEGASSPAAITVPQPADHAAIPEDGPIPQKISEEPTLADIDRYGDVTTTNYMAFLKANGITEDDVMQVLDMLITNGSVVWDFKLFDTIPVEFSLRDSWMTTEIIRMVDDECAGRQATMALYNNLIAEHNIAASLVTFKNEHYSIKTPDDLREAVKRVRAMPYIFTSALSGKLAVFDRIIAAATSQWAIQNFTRPRSAE